jgi:hypothetical protein
MSSSKPEELVAKLYEEGMSDDEVKTQLVDFGLSGREVHHLIKKAKELQKEIAKAKADSKGEEKSEGTQDKAAGKQESATDDKIPEKTPEKAPEAKEPKPSQEGKGFLGLFGKKKKDPQQANAVTEVQQPAPLAEPSIAPSASNVLPSDAGKVLPEKDPLADIFKPLDTTTSKEIPEKTPEKAPEAKEPKPSQEGKGFLGLFGKKKKDAEQANLSEAEKQASPAAKGDDRLSKLAAMTSSSSKESPDKKATKDKKDGKKEKKDKVSEDSLTQAKMKRLSLIKEAISKPVAPAPKKETAKALGDSGDTLQDKFSNKELTQEEEEKLDAETAKQLTDKMDAIETELGQLKELLDTIRELNIKMVEVLEKK